MPRTRSDARKPPIAVNIAAGLVGGLIVSAFVGHLVFGATTELAHRGLMLAFRNGRRG
jgi:hypothetical protein